MIQLPSAIQYHWTTEFARRWIKRSHVLRIHEIGLEIPICRDDVVIDCGANVGVVTSKLARTGATVHAFEPNPHCFAILKNRFKVIPNVRCIYAGVMDRACMLTLRVPGPHEQYDVFDASLAGSFEPDVLDVQRYAIKETQVQCIDLSEFVFSLKRRIRFLKLDIEGSEIPVLHKLIDTGAIHSIDLVGVETHERLSSRLNHETTALRERIRSEGLGDRIRLDWF